MERIVNTAEKILIYVIAFSFFVYAVFAIRRDIRDTRIEVELAELLADKQAVIDDTERGLS
jgi:hypothetical protein